MKRLIVVSYPETRRGESAILARAVQRRGGVQPNPPVLAHGDTFLDGPARAAGEDGVGHLAEVLEFTRGPRSVFARVNFHEPRSGAERVAAKELAAGLHSADAAAELPSQIIVGSRAEQFVVFVPP